MTERNNFPLNTEITQSDGPQVVVRPLRRIVLGGTVVGGTVLSVGIWRDYDPAIVYGGALVVTSGAALVGFEMGQLNRKVGSIVDRAVFSAYRKFNQAIEAVDSRIHRRTH